MILRAMLAVAYATCRASHARQDKDDDPNKKGYPRPPDWGFGVGPTSLHSKKNLLLLRKSSSIILKVWDSYNKHSCIVAEWPTFIDLLV
jgi:hypothetical protein